MVVLSPALALPLFQTDGGFNSSFGDANSFVAAADDDLAVSSVRPCHRARANIMLTNPVNTRGSESSVTKTSTAEQDYYKTIMAKQLDASTREPGLIVWGLEAEEMVQACVSAYADRFPDLGIEEFLEKKLADFAPMLKKESKLADSEKLRIYTSLLNMVANRLYAEYKVVFLADKFADSTKDRMDSIRLKDMVEMTIDPLFYDRGAPLFPAAKASIYDASRAVYHKLSWYERFALLVCDNADNYDMAEHMTMDTTMAELGYDVPMIEKLIADIDSLFFQAGGILPALVEILESHNDISFSDPENLQLGDFITLMLSSRLSTYKLAMGL